MNKFITLAALALLALPCSAKLISGVMNNANPAFDSLTINVNDTVEPPVFTGTGVDDASSGGNFNLSGSATYTIIIDSEGTEATEMDPEVPDTFKWKKDSGAFTTGVAITGAAQVLADGVTITFATTVGHTLNDQWVIEASAPSAITVNGSDGSNFLSVNNTAGDPNLYVDGTISVTGAIDGSTSITGDTILATTSVSSLILLSPATGGSDNILIKPAGTTALTIAEGGNVTIVGDLVITGEDIEAQVFSSSVTGGSDDITFKPAGTLALTVAEGGDVTAVGTVTGNALVATTSLNAATVVASTSTTAPLIIGSTNDFLQRNSSNFYISIDSDNDQSDREFAIGHDSTSAGSNTLFLVKEAGHMQLTTNTTSLPTCNSGNVGVQAMYRKGTGVTEKISLCICEELVNNAYTWGAATSTGDCT